MPRYFFHQYVRGQRTEDPRGILLPDDGAACHKAVQQTPASLKEAAQDCHYTHVATEVTDGHRTLFIVRGKVIVEPQNASRGRAEKG
jgi:hypothetical protein